MAARPESRPPLVIKLGGELLEDGTHLRSVVSALAFVAENGPLVVVHGGGKEIDAALKTAGIAKRQVDGLRVTDEPTLAIVVQVLAGAVNTKLVAALNMAGVPAVGLTGADAKCGLANLAPPHPSIDGPLVDLGLVGIPDEAADTRLLTTLANGGFVPVLSSIGLATDGRLLNVNADVLAGHVAARLAARRLVIAGTTSGVLDDAGATLPLLDSETIMRLVNGRTATAGMIAKLRACEYALAHGAGDVVIVDGRDRAALEAAALKHVPATATRVTTAVNAQRT